MESGFDDETLLTVEEASRWLKISKSTLNQMRVDGTGPKFIKMGPGEKARVVYTRRAIINWLEGRTYGSTSEYDK